MPTAKQAAKPAKTAAKTAAAKKASAKKAPAKKAAAKKTVAKKTTASRGAEKGQDAIALLTADHAEVKQLFEQYEDLVDDDADDDEKQALANEICRLLTAHATIEEEIFYPAARETIDDMDLLDEAEVEHATAKDLIAQIESMQPDEDLYDAKVKVLGEYINHHVEEEEDEMFPKVRKSEMDLGAVGAELQQRKDALLGEVETV